MQDKPKERRISKACDQCSRYRRKCNGEYPCVLCVEKGRNCSYTKPVRKRGPESKASLQLNPLKPPPKAKAETPSLKLSTVVKLPHSMTNISPTVIPFLARNFNPKFNQPVVIKNPVSGWTSRDFLVTRVFDVNGNVSSILDMYFGYPYQHIPMFSKLWIQQNIQDLPMHVLHAMYILVLANPKYAVPNGLLTARPHAAFVRTTINEGLEDCDPFTVATLINLAMYEFYLRLHSQSILHISMAMKFAQILGFDRDVDLKWRSTASGRMLGNEIGMDKQFLRSMWFLLYQWDHHNVLVYHNSLMIDSIVPDTMVSTYVPPNVGDSSNIPLKYVVPLISLGKQVFWVDSHVERMNLLYRLDNFHKTLPISYLPQRTIFLGRTINWLTELYQYSKFCLLVPLYLDPYFIPFDRTYVPNQLETSVNAMFATAVAYITFSNNQVEADSSFLFYSKTMFVAALVHCMLRNIQPEFIKVFAEAIRLTGYPQDYDLLWESTTNPEKAEVALTDILTFS